jgi:hypothetical protein
MDRPYQTSYVPELPPVNDANKENPNISKPKFKTLSSKANNGTMVLGGGLKHQQLQPSQNAPRFVLGNISTNVATSSKIGVKPIVQNSSLPPLTSRNSNNNRNLSTSNIKNPVSGLGEENAKPSLNTSASSTTSEKLTKIIQETNARNSVAEMEKRQFLANSSTMYKKKSLLGSSAQTTELLSKGSGRQDIYKTLSLNPARLRGAVGHPQPVAAPSLLATSKATPNLVFGLPNRSSSTSGSIPSSSLEISRIEEQCSFTSLSGSVGDKQLSPHFELSDVQMTVPRIDSSETHLHCGENQSSTVLKSNDDTRENEAEEERKRQEAEDEETARAQRRKQQKEEEMARRGTELVNRARAKEQDGDTAAALALFKEALVYFPDNDKLKSRVDSLRSQLRGMTLPATNGEQSEDPLEALFGTGHDTKPDNLAVNDQVETRSVSPTVAVADASEAQLKANKNEMILNALLSKAASFSGSKQKFTLSATQIVRSMLEIEAFQKELDKQHCDTTKKKKSVRFHSMDCAIDPPPTQPTGEDFDSSLYPIDRVIESLCQSVKSGDEARKLAGGSTAKGGEQTRLWLKEINELLLDGDSDHELNKFITCTVNFTVGKTTCPCMDNSKSHCLYSAIPLRDRLGQMLSMGLRFCMRRAFNQRGLFLQPGSGSYRYAFEDVASVTHQALLLFETRLHTVDSIVLLGKSSTKVATADQVARVGEFVEAHKFLSDLFPTEEKCLEIQDSDSACWAKIRKYLSLAREHKCEDELVLAPLANLPDLVKKLKEQGNLVAAARSHVDFAFRKALKEDSCGQCTCEGARRRRAYALGTWIAPSLTSLATSMTRSCGKCSKSVLEKDVQISCECCQKPFHLKCVGLPTGYESDYVCSKCVPKFKTQQPSNITAEEDDE